MASPPSEVGMPPSVEEALQDQATLAALAAAVATVLPGCVLMRVEVEES